MSLEHSHPSYRTTLEKATVQQEHVAEGPSLICQFTKEYLRMSSSSCDLEEELSLSPQATLVKYPSLADLTTEIYFLTMRALFLTCGWPPSCCVFPWSGEKKSKPSGVSSDKDISLILRAPSP